MSIKIQINFLDEFFPIYLPNIVSVTQKVIYK